MFDNRQPRYRRHNACRDAWRVTPGRRRDMTEDVPTLQHEQATTAVRTRYTGLCGTRYRANTSNVDIAAMNIMPRVLTSTRQPDDAFWARGHQLSLRRTLLEPLRV